MKKFTLFVLVGIVIPWWYGPLQLTRRPPTDHPIISEGRRPMPCGHYRVTSRTAAGTSSVSCYMCTRPRSRPVGRGFGGGGGGAG